MKNKNGKRDKFGKWKNKRQDKRHNHGKQNQKSPSKTETTPTKVWKRHWKLIPRLINELFWQKLCVQPYTSNGHCLYHLNDYIGTWKKLGDRETFWWGSLVHAWRIRGEDHFQFGWDCSCYRGSSGIPDGQL